MWTCEITYQTVIFLKKLIKELSDVFWYTVRKKLKLISCILSTDA